MNINRFRKKALSASTLVKTYAEVLGNVARKNRISYKELAMLDRIKARLDNDVVYTDRLGNKKRILSYLGKSLVKGFDLGTRLLLFGANKNMTKDEFIKALNAGKFSELPGAYRGLRSLLSDIHRLYIPDVNYRNIKGPLKWDSRINLRPAEEFPLIPLQRSLTNARIGLPDYLKKLKSRMSLMPQLLSVLETAFSDSRNALNRSLAKAYAETYKPNGKSKRYKRNQPIYRDKLGRTYYRDSRGMYFTLVLPGDAGKNIYKVTRLKTVDGKLVPKYNTREYWSEARRILQPVKLGIEENGKIKLLWTYEDGSPYDTRFIADVTPPKGGQNTQAANNPPVTPLTLQKVQTAADTTPPVIPLGLRPTGKPASANVAVNTAANTTSTKTEPLVNVNAAGDTVLEDAPVGSASAYIRQVIADAADTAGYSLVTRQNAPRKLKYELLLAAFNPPLTISVGGTTGAQSRAAKQTTEATAALAPLVGNQQGSQKLPFFERLKQGTRLHLSRNRGVYGTLGGATIGSLVTNMLSGGGGSGISLEDLLRMSQWQQAYNMAVNQRSFWLRLFGDMQSVQGNFLANLRNYGWTDLQIKAYRKRFAGA